MHDFNVMLDSGANCEIYKNAQLLTDMHETDCQAIISGIGGKLTTNVGGHFKCIRYFSIRKQLLIFYPNLLKSTMKAHQ